MRRKRATRPWGFSEWGYSRARCEETVTDWDAPAPRAGMSSAGLSCCRARTLGIVARNAGDWESPLHVSMPCRLRGCDGRVPPAFLPRALRSGPAHEAHAGAPGRPRIEPRFGFGGSPISAPSVW